ncbi:3-deoxy-D-manno-octulosonic acid transferase [Xenorhabdus ishibashii]|uniref:3-deoxy-D-manno-octulosonic acid transferase n=1 Tax=Xenorhabdus ishibashii TaxID=1034471 RepID=A0A2D0KFY9_9GAMM|nr:3-deoxy-D-manno-octulosonic acid transferase [Xenorhabdus ishibashii]
MQLDKDYPVSVLAFCIFYKEHYLSKVLPKLQKLKFDYFGHGLVILHENEIRKEKGDFTIFKNREEKNQFLDRLNSIISDDNLALIYFLLIFNRF